MQQILPDTARITGEGHLEVGGCNAVVLAERFGTPLLVFDRATFESRAKAYVTAVPAERVFYAGKAFCCVAICQLADRLGLGLDVCTGGELATAVAAGFPPERIVFHGNNKSPEELAMASKHGVGRIVVDSFEEMDRIANARARCNLLVRVTPGVEAHTHEFVQTGQEDSKFGFTIASGVALEATKRAMDVPGCELVGIHAHIGSQIFELAAFDLAVRRLAGFAAEVKESLGCEIAELNLGGGLGIAHTGDETTLDPASSAKAIVGAVEREFHARDLSVPRLALEPGRSIVGPAVVTLYRVGTIKRIPGVRTYVSVDGGMSDNVRPALYGARYEALLANRAAASPGPRVTIAGKHCESGDVLVKDVHVAEDVEPGDLLCIPATGSYTYSMASNYNRVPRPAVVMVEDGHVVEIIRRETNVDLLDLDRNLDGSALENAT